MCVAVQGAISFAWVYLWSGLELQPIFPDLSFARAVESEFSTVLLFCFHWPPGSNAVHIMNLGSNFKFLIKLDCTGCIALWVVSWRKKFLWALALIFSFLGMRSQSSPRLPVFRSQSSSTFWDQNPRSTQRGAYGIFTYLVKIDF